jgi:regulator of protease activity HflC (stomatin/prohibitin superfamily)
VSITYYISGASAPDVVQKLGTRDDVEEAIIVPAMSESVKAVTAMYTAEELVTKRPQAKRLIQEKVGIFMDETLKSKDLPGSTIRISNIAITDFEFSREFNRAIESKVKAEQEAKQAENEKVRRITQAEAAAQEQHLQAEAEAFKITQLAKARSDAIRQESQALKNNPELIQLRLAEKWNGVQTCSQF